MEALKFTSADFRPTVPGRYMTRYKLITVTPYEEVYFDGELFRNRENKFECYPQAREWFLMEADA